MCQALFRNTRQSDELELVCYVNAATRWVWDLVAEIGTNKDRDEWFSISALRITIVSKTMWRASSCSLGLSSCGPFLPPLLIDGTRTISVLIIVGESDARGYPSRADES